MTNCNRYQHHLALATVLLVAIVACATGCKRWTSDPATESKKNPAEERPAELEPITETPPSYLSTQNDEALPKTSDLPTEVAKETTLVEPTKPEPTWSVQRWIALAPDGPIMIELAANIGGEDLESVSQRAVQRAIEQITADLPKPWSWDKLLDHKLIRSGWLGNLLPDSGQRSQVTSMYNSDGDEEVQEAEFTAFLTRGLSRGSPLRFSDIGIEPTAAASGRSPWGKLDSNQDNQLDSAEITSLFDQAMRLDTNGDRILTLQEIRPDRAAPSANMTNDGGMLDFSTSILIDKKASKRVGKLVLEHYSFLGSISRDQFSGLSDEQWNQIDTNHDMKLEQTELNQLSEASCHVRIEACFSESSSDVSFIRALSKRPEWKYGSRTSTFGKFYGPRFAIGVALNDSYTGGSKQLFRQQLMAAFDNPQIQMLLRSQLQLGENAFDILDEDGDKKLSDMEFEKAWHWTSATRSNRLVLRWMAVVQDVWFSIADTDGDHRVTEIELQSLVKQLKSCDLDQDGSVAPNEIPFNAKLEINRADPRMASNPNGDMQTTPAVGLPSDWFASSDSNNDGFVSKKEFLGDSEDFAGYDRDNDGFISRQETYEVK
jgi:Ca2+-binding EF-hand superfamily protein